MLDFGFSELVLTGLVALIVLGPKRLPEVARTAGKWVGRMRRFVDGVKQDINRELQAEELAHLKKLQEDLHETRNLIADSTRVLLEDPAKSIDAPIEEPVKAESAKNESSPNELALGKTVRETVKGTSKPKVARKKKVSSKSEELNTVMPKPMMAKPAPRKKRGTTTGQS